MGERSSDARSCSRVDVEDEDGATVLPATASVFASASCGSLLIKGSVADGPAGSVMVDLFLDQKK